MEKQQSTLTNLKEKMQKDIKDKWIWALIFLVIACIITLTEFRFEERAKFLFIPLWWTNTKQLFFRPTFLSGLLSLLVVVPLYTRRLLKWDFNIHSVIILILVTWILASIIQLGIGGTFEVSKKGMIYTGNTMANIIIILFAASLLLSWVGMKSIAGLGWILLVIAASISTIKHSSIIGIRGFFFLISAFLGLIFLTKLRPDMLVTALKEDFVLHTESFANRIKEDIQATGKEAGDLINSASNKFFPKEKNSNKDKN